MKTILSDEQINQIKEKLAGANTEFERHYPGEPASRQPIQTVYGGAQIFKAESASRLGGIALKTLQEYAPEFTTLARVLDFPGSDLLPDDPARSGKLAKQIAENPEKYRADNPNQWIAWSVYQRIEKKLKEEPVEDFRIDFEDGYGNRPDEEEDSDAERTAREVAKGMDQQTLPPFIGIRIKPLTEELKDRGLRTLNIFIATLLDETGGRLPDNFVVTIPKVVSTDQVEALVDAFEAIEEHAGLSAGTLKLELMIETPQTIMDRSGESLLPKLIVASDGRCTGAHFGVYDYTASVNITADYQTMDHPACDFARYMMKVAFAQTGIFLSDGATNVMPVGPHRPPKEGSLTEDQIRENHKVVHRAWKLMFDHVNHSLSQGYYQGWDLNPGQFPIRYAAVYLFFLKSLNEATSRLKNFVDQAAQATLAGDVFDDAATGQGLLNYFLKGLNCGAITRQEAEATGLTLDEIRSRSFVKILEGRKK